MLEMLGQRVPARRGNFTAIRLETHGGRLRVEQGPLVAEMDAMVWEEGRCAICAARLNQALRGSLHEAVVVLELEQDYLRLGRSAVPCVSECPPVQWKRPSQIYFATGFGLAPSESMPVSVVA